MTRLRTAIALALALSAALVISACGGDSGGDEDPQEVLAATFSNQEEVTSGVFDVSFELEAEGGSDAGTFKASLGGPFQGGGDTFPSFDIDADAELDSESQDFSGSAGLISTGDSAFVSFQDTNYEIPAQTFSQFSSTYEQLQKQAEQQQTGDGNFLANLGINPTDWLTDVSNEGDEDVEGTETIHISGEADVPKLVEDLKKVAEKAPQATQQVTPAQLGQLDQLTDLVESADFDIYTGKDDDILRKLEADLTLKPSGGEDSTGPDSANLKVSITLSELNEPQEVAAPSDPQPIQGLLDQLGVDPSQLGGLGSALDAGDAGAGALPQAGGSTQAPSGDASSAYLECLSQASGQQALDQCAALLE